MLSVISVDTWSLGIPTIHAFIKTFNIGRKALLTVITKCKCREVTEQVGRTTLILRIFRNVEFGFTVPILPAAGWASGRVLGL